jgi:hypothetical protein
MMTEQAAATAWYIAQARTAACRLLSLATSKAQVSAAEGLLTAVEAVEETAEMDWVDWVE